MTYQAKSSETEEQKIVIRWARVMQNRIAGFMRVQNTWKLMAKEETMEKELKA